MEHSGGLREAKKRETRRRLELGALRLFREHGFDATSVEDIAREAEVSPRTFFRYFGTKEDVVFASRPAELRLLRTLIAARPADEPSSLALARALMWLASALDARSELVAARTAVIEQTEALRGDALRGFEDWVDAVALSLARRRGATASDDRSRGLATMGISLFFVAIREWHEKSENASISDAVYRLLTASAEAMGAPIPPDWAGPAGYSPSGALSRASP